MRRRIVLSVMAVLGWAGTLWALPSAAQPVRDAAIGGVLPKVVEWRRDIHEHPELGNRETRTSKLVADHLRGLGLDVRTGIAHTGVVGVLRGAKPGPVIALRADMDALPVTEQTDVPFRSVATAEYRGQQVGVMHACGHDGHTAILMGVAQVLASMKTTLPGTVVFLFQPAEEGAPEGETGGAALMLEQGAFDEPRPEAVFGLHLWSPIHAGRIGYRSGPMMAAADTFRLVVNGRQTHGSRPWGGVDPIVVAAQIVTGMQTIVSRQTDIASTPVVVSVGAINGGIRHNIIPESVEMLGTMRTFDPVVREQTLARLRATAEHIAAASGATTALEIRSPNHPVTVNDPDLTRRMLPVLESVTGPGKVVEIPYITAAEDFSAYANRVPGLFLMIGSTPPDQDAAQAPSNHSPLFFVDETSLEVGLRALLAVSLDYLGGGAP